MSKKIIHNYPPDSVQVSWCEQNTSVIGGQLLLVYSDDLALPGKKTPLLSLPESGENFVLPSSGIAIILNAARGFDIHGTFAPNIVNDTSLDEQLSTAHTMYFGNSLFRKQTSLIENSLKEKGAFSQHLKAELVELFYGNSMILPHCHGTVQNRELFLMKFASEFKIDPDNFVIDENYAHPQLFIVLEGTGKVYLDSECHEISSGDVVIFGENVLHGTISGKEGLRFIHFAWLDK